MASLPDPPEPPIGQSAGERFEEWLRAPLGEFPPVPGYHVRRAEPGEYDAIYDLVDDAFGYERPRSFYEWLYRRNPQGPARCMNVIETATKQMICTAARFPWPGAIGDQPALGLLAGDIAVRRGVRGRGIGKLQADAWRAHPLYEKAVTVGWPNEASVRYTLQRGMGSTLAPLRHAALKLQHSRLSPWLVQLRQRLHRALTARSQPALRVESVTRFDERYREIAARCMRSDGVWFPRDAEFLTWRYLAHPFREYHALALERGDELLGFCVVNLDGRRATLMELAAPRAEAAALLAAAADKAREGGCRRIEFFATAGFPRWGSLPAAGYRVSESQRMAFLDRHGFPDPRGEAWSVTPAENEVL